MDSVALCVLCLSAVLWCCTRGSCYYFHDESEPTYLVVRVGQYVLLNCEVDFEQAYAVPYMVKWRKDVSNKCYDASEYVGRLQLKKTTKCI